MASAKMKRKKFVKTVSKNKIIKAKKKTSKIKCKVCKKLLHGVPHAKTNAQISRMGKSKKKPSVLFAGVLCNQCRQKIIDQAILVKRGAKKIEEVSISKKELVKKAMAVLK